MGWCSGTEIFDDVTGMIIDQDLDDDEKHAIIKRLVVSLESGDWDCQSDSEYYDDPIVQQVFKELHPDWFEDDADDLKQQLEKVTRERNYLAGIVYAYCEDNEITLRSDFVDKWRQGYYK